MLQEISQLQMLSHKILPAFALPFLLFSIVEISLKHNWHLNIFG